MIHRYLQTRTTLVCTFVLIDSRVSPQESDLEFINWLGESRVPFVLVYTKADKLKPEELEGNLEAFRKELLKTWSELPQEFITSAVQKTGRGEVLQFIQEVNLRYQQQVGFRKK
jgi:GTP-binding protein